MGWMTLGGDYLLYRLRVIRQHVFKTLYRLKDTFKKMNRLKNAH